jgi:hypothetical protein
VILSTDGLDQDGRRLRRPQPLLAQQVQMPFAGAQGAPVHQGFLQGAAHRNRQFLIGPLGVTLELAIGLGRHTVVYAWVLPMGRLQR